MFLSGWIINFSQLCLFFNWRCFTRRGLFCYDVHLFIFLSSCFHEPAEIGWSKDDYNRIGSSISLKPEKSRIDSCNWWSVCFLAFWLFVCLFFIIRKGQNSITIKDYLSSSLQFFSSSIACKIPNIYFKIFIFLDREELKILFSLWWLLNS